MAAQSKCETCGTLPRDKQLFMGLDGGLYCRRCLAQIQAREERRWYRRWLRDHGLDPAEYDAEGGT